MYYISPGFRGKDSSKINTLVVWEVEKSEQDNLNRSFINVKFVKRLYDEVNAVKSGLVYPATQNMLFDTKKEVIKGIFKYFN